MIDTNILIVSVLVVAVLVSLVLTVMRTIEVLKQKESIDKIKGRDRVKVSNPGIVRVADPVGDIPHNVADVIKYTLHSYKPAWEERWRDFILEFDHKYTTREIIGIIFDDRSTLETIREGFTDFAITDTNGNLLIDTREFDKNGKTKNQIYRISDPEDRNFSLGVIMVEIVERPDFPVDISDSWVSYIEQEPEEYNLEGFIDLLSFHPSITKAIQIEDIDIDRTI